MKEDTQPIFKQYIAELEAAQSVLCEIADRLDSSKLSYKRLIWELQADFLPAIKANKEALNLLRIKLLARGQNKGTN
tara:strand:- start:122 stop:352 length:231 start_codon:yes stop_codon:yes gene_type:complete